ncbi:helix-turn-helix transcriptional regulator [Aquamicrobium sp.]|uniref:helix-turn-helix transcriptional regulator n=1 Tax=Aquamicrobium sp. TaxID=1872579 RepID=UPI002584D90C|nr:helix-turn-helix transcriptional regulator [Aquamicrobium sp.]MCK9550532.1 helix-turn-helix transcriptional regulator [Aquamicrobium sp.]
MAVSSIFAEVSRMPREVALGEIVGQIYETGHDATGLHGVLNGLKNLFNGSRACLTRFVDGSTQSIQAVDDKEFLCDAALDAFRRDPFFSATRQMPVGKAFLQEEITDSDSFRRRELFSDWYAPRDMFNGLSGNLTFDDGSTWFLDLQRGRRQAGFDRTDATALSMIIHHVMRAWSLEAKIRREGIETAMAAMDDAIFIIDPGGRVETMNRHARTLLDRNGNTLHVGHMNQLKGCGVRETNRIKALVRSAQSSELPESGHLFLRTASAAGDHAPSLDGVFLRAIRLPVAQGASQESSSVLVAVRTISETGCNELTGLIVQECGLTPAETRIALAIASGLPLKDAAACAGISFNTARFHLRQVFAKTGTKQQSQLVALLRPV